MTMPSEKKLPGSSQFPKTLDFLPVSPLHRNSCTTRLLKEPFGLSLARFKRQAFSHPGAHHGLSTVSRDAVALLVLSRKRCPQHSPFLQLGFKTLWNTGPRLVPETSIIPAQPRVFTGGASQGRPSCGGASCCRKMGGRDGPSHRGLWMLGRAYHPASVPMSPVAPRPRYEIYVRCLEGLLSPAPCLTRSTVFPWLALTVERTGRAESHGQVV